MRPHIFGFSLTPTVIGVYACGCIGMAVLAAMKFGWRSSVLIILMSGWFYFGMEKIP